MMKEDCRNLAKGIVQSLSLEKQLRASEAICKTVFSLDAYAQARTVFCYVSLPTEPDTQAILAHAFSRNKRVLVPRCEQKGIMHAVEIHALDELSPGSYCILEPPKAFPAFVPAEIDLAIVPCVACSRDKKRLGRGAGYYDRFLKQTDAFCAALCFDELILEFEEEPHDMRMHAVITQTAVY